MKRSLLSLTVMALCLSAGRGGFLSTAFGGEEKNENRALPSQDSALIVATSGDEVEFTWHSKTNRTYVILAADRASEKSPWVEIPGLTRVEGTGSPITIKMHIPNAQQYRYSLRTFAPDKKKSWWRR